MVCIECGKEYLGSSDICPVCQARKNREYFISRGICPHCRKNPIFKGEKSCPECKAVFANWSAEFRSQNREHTNRLAAKSHKNTYWKRKEAGICVRCGKRKPIPEMTLCGICRAKASQSNRKASKKRGNEIPRSERVANGLCYFCGAELDREGRSCKKCAAKCAKSLESMDRSNHVWRKMKI